MSGRRTAILISGRGSNMMALIDAAQDDDYPADISLVISNVPDAEGLQRAEAKGIATRVIDHTIFEEREDFEATLQRVLDENQIELVCCAGFMRLMSESLVETWRNKMINIHPSLLPSYKGLDTHARVIRDGMRITGCTAHYVRAAMDSGPVIIQAAVAVNPMDTPESLAKRVLESEHLIFPWALKLVASGQVRVAGEEVRYSATTKMMPALISPAP